ncbi:preprotein translocase subunit SecY [bacterium]|nr:MAG: preprotein translocase subunit SecY [bacterium]
MRKLVESISNIWKIPDLRRKILYTLLFVTLYRLGGHIPLPGINLRALSEYFAGGMAGPLQMFDLFVGGALRRATIFATGIMPYITASIMFQLLGAVIPYFQQLQKMGEEGRRKINQYTRYAALVIAAMQGWGMIMYLRGLEGSSGPVVAISDLSFMFLGVLSLTTGAAIIMWLGELITEKGIGNGMSILILVGIIARLPQAIIQELIMLKEGGRSFVELIIIAIFAVLFTMAAIMLTQGTRSIPVQYARRVVGRKVYGGQSTHLPLRVNASGVIPIIFAQAVMFLPQTIARILPQGALATFVEDMFAYSGVMYNFIYGLLVVFFAYFYTAVIFNPVDVADNLKKYGGFIPGRRPGAQTSEYIDRVLTRITLPGAIGLALIAILPLLLIRKMNFAFFFGGTSLLIIVGVVLDTLQQIETNLLVRHYDGFMKKGKIKARR